MNGQSTYFPPVIGNTWQTIDPASMGWCTDQLPPLVDFLGQSNTKAFIVLKDGRIAIEHYFGTFTQDSLWYWASAGKSLTAFLVGKAQEEGYLDIADPTSDYLGAGWTSCTPEQEQAITIRHQLTMTSGLDDGTGDVDCTEPPCLQFLAEPGTRWAYHNAPYTLLDGVIAGATGGTLNAYVFNKLTLTTGLQGAYLQLGYNNVFFSKPRSMARFGLLAMAGGVWNGNAVMNDQAYFNDMVSPTQTLNEAYGYLWWLNGQSTFMLPGVQFPFNGMLMPNAPVDAFSAMGKNGQLCNVSPSTGLVVVRMGDLPTQGIFVPNIYNDQIWQYLNAVICSTTGTPNHDTHPVLSVAPNPAMDRVSVTLDDVAPARTELLGADGRIVIAESSQSTLALSHQPEGIYILRATGLDSRVVHQRLIIAR
ncbi:MAG: serine hydrolase [Flavobacteriales bacterium]|nr:serine hydrolase [Flavobacteriales bacterium]